MYECVFSTFIFQLNDSIELVILQTTISIENAHTDYSNDAHSTTVG